MEAIALPSLTNWETSGLVRRSNVYLTSAAVKGLPLWNLTPLRRVNFQVSGSGCSYFSARAGMSLPSVFCRCIRPSKMLVMGPSVASPFSLWGFIDFGGDSTATTRDGAANAGWTAMKPPYNARIKPMQLITLLIRIVTFLSLELTGPTPAPASDVPDAKRYINTPANTTGLHIHGFFAGQPSAWPRRPTRSHSARQAAK